MYASAEAKGNRKIMLEAIKQDGCALRFASAALKDDREIVREAVKQNGCALDYASAELKGDREIVMVAVKQYGGALQYASAELKGDREIVMLRPFCVLPFNGVVAFDESEALDSPLGALAGSAFRFVDFETDFSFIFAFVVFSALSVAFSSRRFASSALFFFRSSSRSF